jgi:nicotinate-nucleotide adenylyltransferase
VSDSLLVAPGRLGILGGTFDPPHIGHLVLAETARVQLALDRVLFVPVGQPPHKVARPITGATHRVGLVQAAIAQNPAFVLSRADLDRAGPHYTVDMLALVQGTYPEAVLYLLLGGDSLAELHTWWDPAGIAAQARLAVMTRPGSQVDMDLIERTVPGIRSRITQLDVPPLGISSTDLRRRVRQRLPVRYLVTEPVATYIREKRLYLGDGA